MYDRPERFAGFAEFHADCLLIQPREATVLLELFAADEDVLHILGVAEQHELIVDVFLGDGRATLPRFFTLV